MAGPEGFAPKKGRVPIFWGRGFKPILPVKTRKISSENAQVASECHGAERAYEPPLELSYQILVSVSSSSNFDALVGVMRFLSKFLK